MFLVPTEKLDATPTHAEKSRRSQDKLLRVVDNARVNRCRIHVILDRSAAPCEVLERSSGLHLVGHWQTLEVFTMNKI